MLISESCNPYKYVYLGETSVKIDGFHGYPSIHLVKSYMLADGNEVEHGYRKLLSYFFYFLAGTTAINYGQREFNQVRKLIQLR